MPELIPFPLIPLIEQSVTKFEARLRDRLKFFATDAVVSEETAAYREELTRVTIAALAIIPQHPPTVKESA